MDKSIEKPKYKLSKIQDFKYRLISLFRMIELVVIWIVGVLLYYISFKNIDLFKMMGWKTPVPND
tara:strand:- start:164 stop:358 length:195 start_codon:yes stop_codon:yes gene_type:complete